MVRANKMSFTVLKLTQSFVGLMLCRMYKSAIANRNQQTEAHRGFTSGLPAELVKEWEGQCVEWEKAEYPKSESGCVNPYATEESVAERNVRTLYGHR